MAKKRKKNNNDKISKATQTGALLEHIDEKVTLVAEQYGDIRKDVSTIKTDIGILKEDVGVLKDDVKVLKEDVGVLKDDVEVIKMDIEFIKHELKNKISRDEFAALEKRVALLEGRR